MWFLSGGGSQNLTLVSSSFGLQKKSSWQTVFRTYKTVTSSGGVSLSLVAAVSIKRNQYDGGISEMMYEIKPAVIMRTVIKLIKASVSKHMYTSTHLHSH